MKQGKIVRLGTDKGTGAFKGFGHVRSDDGIETFVHRTAYPKGMQMLVGDVIQYDVEDSEKGPRAKDVKVLERGSPPTTKPDSPPTPPTTPPPQPQGIEVAWEFGKLITQENQIILPLTLKLTSGKLSRSGIEVTLKANGVEVADPVSRPSTDGSGSADFLVFLAPETEICALAITIKDGEKEKSFARIWYRRKQSQDPDAASHKIPPSGSLPTISIRTEVVGHSDENRVVLRVLTFSSDNAEAVGVKARSVLKCAKTLKATGIGKGQSIHFETDDKGEKLLEVSFVSPHWRGKVFCCLEDNPAVRTPDLYIRQPRQKPRGDSK